MARKKSSASKTPTRSLRPFLIIAAGVILMVVAILLFVNQANPDQKTEITDVAQIERISLDDAYKTFTEKTAVILDVRSSDAFAVNHIPGAINIPLGELENRINELDPKQWIITYCT